MARKAESQVKKSEVDVSASPERSNRLTDKRESYTIATTAGDKYRVRESTYPVT